MGAPAAPGLHQLVSACCLCPVSPTPTVNWLSLPTCWNLEGIWSGLYDSGDPPPQLPDQSRDSLPGRALTTPGKCRRLPVLLPSLAPAWPSGPVFSTLIGPSRAPWPPELEFSICKQKQHDWFCRLKKAHRLVSFLKSDAPERWK